MQQGPPYNPLQPTPVPGNLLFGATSLAAAQQQAQHNYEFEIRRLARSVNVPTNDQQVQDELRKYQQPAIVYGEDTHDRRERLRHELAKQQYEINHTGAIQLEGARGGGEKEQLAAGNVEEEEEEEEQEQEGQDDDDEFYTEGSSALHSWRLKIAQVSIPKTSCRVEYERRLVSQESKEQALDALRRKEASNIVLENAAKMSLTSSQKAHSRPLSRVQFLSLPDTDNAVMFVSACFGGELKLWNGGTGRCLAEVQAHAQRVSGMSSCPRRNMILTCASDQPAAIWKYGEPKYEQSMESEDKKPVNLGCAAKLSSSHGTVFSDICLHPDLDLVAVSCAHESSWCLFDLETQTEVFKQPGGHVLGLSHLAFHPDGSLLATAGRDHAILLWDLRSGKNIVQMERAHADQISAIEFDPRGKEIASGGKDNTVKIWDLRRNRKVCSLVGHTSGITNLRYQKYDRHDYLAILRNSSQASHSVIPDIHAGEQLLVSSSLDGTIRLWASKRGWVQIHALVVPNDKAMCCDVSWDARNIVVGCYDKSWKIFSRVK